MLYCGIGSSRAQTFLLKAGGGGDADFAVEGLAYFRVLGFRVGIS